MLIVGRRAGSARASIAYSATATPHGYCRPALRLSGCTCDNVVFPHQISLAVGARQCRRSVSAQFFESLPSPNIVSAARLQWPLFTGQAVTVLTSVKCAGRSAARYVASCPAGQKNPETAQQSDVHNFLAWLDPVDDRDLAACCTTASPSFFVTLRDVRSSQ